MTELTSGESAFLAEILETALADPGFIDTTSGGGHSAASAQALRDEMARLQRILLGTNPEPAVTIYPSTWERAGHAGELAEKYFPRLNSGRVTWRYDTLAGNWYSTDGQLDVLPTGEANTGLLRAREVDGYDYWTVIGTVRIEPDEDEKD